MPGCLGRKISKFWKVQLSGETQNICRRTSTAVDQNNCSLHRIEPASSLQHGLITMRTFHVFVPRVCEVESEAERVRFPYDVAQAKEAA